MVVYTYLNQFVIHEKSLSDVIIFADVILGPKWAFKKYALKEQRNKPNKHRKKLIIVHMIAIVLIHTMGIQRFQ